MVSPGNEITGALAALANGDHAAREQLWSLVYADLRSMARAQLARERDGATLAPTALVHEAYLRLVGEAGMGDAAAGVWDGRWHFFAAAAEAMRRILV